MLSVVLLLLPKDSDADDDDDDDDDDDEEDEDEEEIFRGVVSRRCRCINEREMGEPQPVARSYPVVAPSPYPVGPVWMSRKVSGLERPCSSWVCQLPMVS